MRLNWSFPTDFYASWTAWDQLVSPRPSLEGVMDRIEPTAQCVAGCYLTNNLGSVSFISAIMISVLQAAAIKTMLLVMRLMQSNQSCAGFCVSIF
jgi:hypothetical protein